jgi:isopentenyldiphosphate isomerase
MCYNDKPMANLLSENDRLLDVVNEEDVVIDSKSREEIHRFGLLHRDIHVWMFDKNGNIFFQKRGLPVQMSGLFDATAGGHLNKGEDYLDAAIRETREETGIKIKEDDLIFIKKVKGIEQVSQNDFHGTINNFFRSVYIYRKPVDEDDLRREAGILGVNFKKFSSDFLKNINKDDSRMFIKFVLENELSDVINHTKKWVK